MIYVVFGQFKGVVSDFDNIFYGMNQKILTKKVISKISVDSNFTFASYAWLCALALLHRLQR